MVIMAEHSSLKSVHVSLLRTPRSLAVNKRVSKLDSF